jgi:hypothetical protein
MKGIMLHQLHFTKVVTKVSNRISATAHLKRLPRNLLLFLRRHAVERAHVVQSVRELHDDDPHLHKNVNKLVVNLVLASRREPTHLTVQRQIQPSGNRVGPLPSWPGTAAADP